MVPIDVKSLHSGGGGSAVPTRIDLKASSVLPPASASGSGSAAAGPSGGSSGGGGGKSSADSKTVEPEKPKPKTPARAESDLFFSLPLRASLGTEPAKK